MNGLCLARITWTFYNFYWLHISKDKKTWKVAMIKNFIVNKMRKIVKNYAFDNNINIHLHAARIFWFIAFTKAGLHR
jgi:hypothetical protein